MDDYGSTPSPAPCSAKARRWRGEDKAGEILRLFKEDRARLVEYNRTDARLALEILERLRLVALSVERSKLTGLPPTACPARSPPSTSSTSRSSDGGAWSPPACAPVPAVEPQEGGTSRVHARALHATSSCWTSRACTRASSARSRSTP
jgi:hypothetical protein